MREGWSEGKRHGDRFAALMIGVDIFSCSSLPTF